MLETCHDCYLVTKRGLVPCFIPHQIMVEARRQIAKLEGKTDLWFLVELNGVNYKCSDIWVKVIGGKYAAKDHATEQ